MRLKRSVVTRFRAVPLTLTWLKEWLKFCVHYFMVWEYPPPKPWLSDEEYREVKERMAGGVLKFEYQRVEALKHKAPLGLGRERVKYMTKLWLSYLPFRFVRAVSNWVSRAWWEVGEWIKDGLYCIPWIASFAYIVFAGIAVHSKQYTEAIYDVLCGVYWLLWSMILIMTDTRKKQ